MEYSKSPAKAFSSKRLEENAFLVSLISDLDRILTDLGAAPLGGHFAMAAILDSPGHHAWAAAGTAAEDARLVWDALRHNDTPTA